MEAFYCCNELETVVLSDSIENISSKAFGNCSNLKKVEIPESLYSKKVWINNYAFRGCTSLDLFEKQKLIKLGYSSEDGGDPFSPETFH